MSNNTGNIVLALLAGAVVGAGIGILVAPDKGSNTRKKIKDGINVSKDDLLAKLNEVMEMLQGKAEDVASSFEDVLENVIQNGGESKEEVIALLEAKLAQLKSEKK